MPRRSQTGVVASKYQPTDKTYRRQPTKHSLLYRLSIDQAEPTLAPWLTNHTFSPGVFSPRIPWQETIKSGHGAKLRDMKVRQVLRLLEDDNWLLVRTRGSHRQFKHPSKAGRVTVAGKPGDDLAPGTLNSILKQAGLKR